MRAMAARIRTMILAATQRRRLLPLDRVVKQCLILVLAGLVIEEIPSLIADLFPTWSKKQIYWFLNPTFHYPTTGVWMLKYIANGIWDVMRAYIIAKLAKQYSLYLFLSMVIYVGYELVGLFMLFWDFKTTHIMFWDFLVTGIVLAKGIFKGYKPETIAKIKSIF